MSPESYAKKYHGPRAEPCLEIWFLWWKAEKRRRIKAAQLERHHQRKLIDPAYVLRRRENNAKSRWMPNVYANRKAYSYAYKRRPGWKEKACERIKQRAKTDLSFRLKKTLRGRLWAALSRHSGTEKCAKSMELLGCTVTEWKTFIESKFRRGMTWENYGTEWHIDHVLPIAKFDLTNPIQQKLAFHYSNTQPLWKTENLSKGDRITNPQLPLLV